VTRIVDLKLNLREKPTESASFIGDLGADSLDVVELVMAFEDEFELEIKDEDMEAVKNIKDVVDYLEKRLS